MELEVQSPDWPEQTAPVRIALLSDIHVDTIHMPPQRISQIADRVRSLHPDVVLLAGDYVGGHLLQSGLPNATRAKRSARQNALEEAGLRALGSFSAPLGVFAVMGNHDCWWDCERVRAILAETPVKLLENQAVRVARAEGGFWVVGVEDGQTQRADFELASKGVPPGAPVITLVHNAGLFDWPSNQARIQFSGHTHAGQVRFPLIGAPVRMSRHTEDTADGWTIEKGRVLVVTRGLGAVGLPVRFGAPPQIMIVTVRYGITPSVVRRSARSG